MIISRIKHSMTKFYELYLHFRISKVKNSGFFENSDIDIYNVKFTRHMWYTNRIHD